MFFMTLWHLFATCWRLDDRRSEAERRALRIAAQCAVVVKGV